MDDAFSLIATEGPRPRRVSPFGVRVAVWSVLAFMLTVTFATWVVGQQRAADARRSAAMAAQAAAREAEARTAALHATSTGAAPVRAPRGAVNDLLDGRARDAATDALAAATQVARTSSLESAGASSLGALDGDVLFVEGPSTGPSVVSVFASAAAWSAAVQGSEGTCFWVALSPGGAARYGTGTRCTGVAALAAARDGW